MPRFEGWYGQFCGVEEQFFAACLLNQLTLRTARQFESGLKCLFRGSVNGAVLPGCNDLELTARLAGRSDPRIRLVPVICDSDPPTKSGPLVLRRLQRILRVHSKWMVWPWTAVSLLKEGAVDHVLFVDDFLGSGKQFQRFIKQWGFLDCADKAAFTYAPVTAHQSGVQHLLNELPFIKVITTEQLNDASSFFSKGVWDELGQGSVPEIDAKSWYLDFAKRRHIEPKTTGPLGVGELALTFGFAHSTPNNALPILWYESPDWQPLLER